MSKLVGCVCLFFSAVSMAQVPNTFQSGEIASAVAVNANFSDLDSRIESSIGGLVLGTVTTSDGDGVAGVSCASTSIVTSANCDCDDGDGTRNFGVLFSCLVAGNGGVAGCFPEGATYNPLLPLPIATIQVVCIAGVRNDGTQITPIFSKSSPPANSKPEPVEIDADGAEYESALNNARSAVAAYSSALQSQ